MNTLIIVPARGGSKGIPNKNIYPLNGKPLLCYTLEVIQSARLNDTDTAVSTDSQAIKNVALSYGVYVVDRPADISGDKALTEDALIHALHDMEQRLNKKYDAVMTLQPTSPLRSPDTLRNFVAAYEEGYPEYDALLSLTESRSDYWVLTSAKSFERLYKDAPRRRQDRKPIYIENSAYYITEVTALLATRSVLGTNVNGFIIPEAEGIDINEVIDLKIAECFLKQ